MIAADIALEGVAPSGPNRERKEAGGTEYRIIGIRAASDVQGVWIVEPIQKSHLGTGADAA
jgi:hypothetical protein